jgi:LPXTG-motif cell wall-anchored protein
MSGKIVGAGAMLAAMLFATGARADLAPSGPDGLTLAAPIVGLLILVGAILLLAKRRKKP